jgi:hypothetical protein
MAWRNLAGDDLPALEDVSLSIAANLDISLREHDCRSRQERALRSVGLWEEVSDRLA